MFIKAIVNRIVNYFSRSESLELILLNQGKILEMLMLEKQANKLSDYEWKIFSQWGEDGIINFLVNEIQINNKTFIEFGVEDFSESNCRFLLMSKDWQGFVIDGSSKNINRLRSQYYYWKYDLQSISAFITAENVNELMKSSGFDADLGILSVDLDGNDFHVLSAIEYFNPRLIVCEFNPIFGPDKPVTVPYDPNFNRNNKHYSNLYFGASIKAMQVLLESRGYLLVGTGMQGGNAYFVRTDLLTKKLLRFSENKMNFTAHWRESLNQSGDLSYLRGADRIKEIQDMPVLNIQTGNIEYL